MCEVTGCRRRRTLSFTALSEYGRRYLTKPLDFDYTKRIRHPSFSFNDDSAGSLHELIEIASLKSGSIDTPFSHNYARLKNTSDTCRKSDLDVRVQDECSRTLLPVNYDLQNRSLELVPMKSTANLISPSAPISSKLVRLYFSKFVSNPVATFDKAEHHGSSGHKNYSSVPKRLKLYSSQLTSMVTPLYQLNRTPAKSKTGSCTPNYLDVGVGDSTHQSFFSECEFSDTESWNHLKPNTTYVSGYQSDNYLDEANKLQLSGHQLELRLHQRYPSWSHKASSHRTSALSDESKSTTVKMLNFNQVCENILHPSLKLCTCHSSVKNIPTAVNAEDQSVQQRRLSNVTRPAAELSSDQSSTCAQIETKSGAIERLRSLLGHVKPATSAYISENDKYFYMDEKSLERRIEAQASNIILPVTF